MVKALTVKPLKAHKSHKETQPSDHDTSEERESAHDDDHASDMDEEAFAVCLTKHDDDTNFDRLVDKCFIILDIGKTKKVTCIVDGEEVQKDVYNVNLTTPMGEIIQLTAWESIAIDICDYFT
jgi:hypothetical protein